MSLSFHPLVNLVEKAGFGVYQMKMCVSLFLLSFQIGVVSILNCTNVNAIQEVFHRSNFEKCFLLVLPFLGMIFGNILSGAVGDSFGRKTALEISQLTFLIVGFKSSFESNFLVILFERFVIGIAYGLVMPCALTYIDEICPENSKNFLLVVLDICFSFGQIYCCILFLLFTPDLRPNLDNWRYVNFLAFLPSVLIFPFSCLFMNESPLYLYNQNKIGQAKKVLKEMAVANLRISRVEWEIENLQKTPPSTFLTEGVWLGDLFSKRYLLTTAIFCYFYFSLNLSQIGIDYSKPNILQAAHLKRLSPAFVLLIFEILDLLSPMIFCLFSNWGFFSVISSLSIFTLLMALTNFGIVSFDSGFFLFGSLCIFLTQLLICGIALQLNKTSTSAYHSQLRATGSGFCHRFGRIGSAVSPILYEIFSGKKDNFLFFSFTTGHLLLCSFFVLFLKFPSDAEEEKADGSFLLERETIEEVE